MPGPFLTTSWDDGHPADLRLAERLGRHGIRATFYVLPPENGDSRRLSDADLRDLAGAGFEIGAHTADHTSLPGLPVEIARRQIETGKKRLEDILGASVRGFAYPKGLHDRTGRRLVAEAGFRYGRTARALRLDRGTDPFRMPTTAHFYPSSGARLLRHWMKHDRGYAGLGALLAARRGGAAGIHDLLDLAARRRGLFHLWGHSWEIDELGLWDALDRLLEAAAIAIPPARRLTNGAVWETAPPGDAP